MPDTTPSPAGPIGTAIDRAEERLAELNVALAYTPDLPNLSTHLTTVQDTIAALDALRTDL